MERFSYLAEVGIPKSYMQALLQSPSETSLRTAYELMMAYKGKATRLSMRQKRVGRFMPKAVRQSVDQLRRIQARLASLLFLPESEHDENYSNELARLRKERNEKERAIHLYLGKQRDSADPSLSVLQQGLQPDQAFVDYFLVGDELYGWFVRSQESPKLFSLGLEETLQEELAQFLQEIQAQRGGRAVSSNPTDRISANALLWKRIWAPMAEWMEGVQTLIIAPDGSLSRVPFSALRGPDGRYLLEQVEIYYVQDAISLAQRSHSAVSGGDLLAIGDVDYFRKEKTHVDSPINLLRSGRYDRWLPLPASRAELQAVSSFHEDGLGKTHRQAVLDRRTATEENVKELVSKFSFVHFATHGFFEPDDLPTILNAEGSEEENLVRAEQRRTAEMLPGLLAGLVLAGANETPDPGREDGYLTADEVSFLDLSHCELIVLSACETALGTARAGEGLMSLRRAFQVAGAKMVLSTLWKIGDDSTTELMISFYEGLWYGGKSASKALRDAQLSLLRRNRAKYGEGRPSDWAAFVLFGNH
jgi:CHAT domain-containing protein